MGDFFRFSENIENSKGKFTLEVNNTENFRLRRAKINEFQQNSIENRSNLAKIAPEGREFFFGCFLDEHFLRFRKSNKKTLIERILRIQFAALNHLKVHDSKMTSNL